MEKLVETLGITRLSRSQVSNMAKELDKQVADFRSRPLDAGQYTFVTADALVLKVREGGQVVNVHALVATGVNADGTARSWVSVVKSFGPTVDSAGPSAAQLPVPWPTRPTPERIP